MRGHAVALVLLGVWVALFGGVLATLAGLPVERARAPEARPAALAAQRPDASVLPAQPPADPPS